MKRKIYDELIKWKERNGEVDLLIDGAKGVGKSYIVEKFAQENYESYILIDFNKVGKEIKELFDYLFTNYILHIDDLKVENDIIFLPLYMTGLL